MAEASPERIEIKSEQGARGCEVAVILGGATAQHPLLEVLGAPHPLPAAGVDPVVAGVQGRLGQGRVGRRLLFTGRRVSGYFSHQLQAGLLGPGGQKEALEARGVGQ